MDASSQADLADRQVKKKTLASGMRNKRMIKLALDFELNGHGREIVNPTAQGEEVKSSDVKKDDHEKT